jgi:hypothetical protein
MLYHFVFFNNTIYSVQARYIIIETKEVSFSAFVLRVTALGLRTSAFTCVLMWKKKPAISNTASSFVLIVLYLIHFCFYDKNYKPNHTAGW